MALLSSNKVISCRLLVKRFFSSTTTIDKNEIEHFKKFTSEWWNEYGPMKPLHAMNGVRVPFIRDGLISEGNVAEEYLNTATPLKGLTILDVGCGGGILTEALSKIGGNVTGIDGNQDLINAAKQHSKINNLNINYIYSSIEDHSKENCEKYNAVVLSEVIEHIDEKEQFLDACTRCLKPSGSIFITTLNKTWLSNIVTILIGETFNIIPRGTHQYSKYIGPAELERMLEDDNVRTKIVHGLMYSPISNVWYWTNYNSISYALHGIKLPQQS